MDVVVVCWCVVMIMVVLVVVAMTCALFTCFSFQTHGQKRHTHSFTHKLYVHFYLHTYFFFSLYCKLLHNICGKKKYGRKKPWLKLRRYLAREWKKYMWIMDLRCNQQFHVILEYSINFLAQNYLSIFFPHCCHWIGWTIEEEKIDNS